MKIAKADPERERIERLLNQQEKRIRDAFTEYLTTVRSSAVLRQVREALEAGDIARAMSVLDSYIATLAAVIPAIIVDVGRQEIEAMRAMFRRAAPAVSISFDPGNPRAAELMRASRLEFITNFTNSQRNAVREALQDALERGLSPIQSARAFRDAIGLTDGQMQWVRRYRRALESGDADELRRALDRDLRDRRFDRSVEAALDGRRNLTQDQIDRMVTRYQERALVYRSEVIARTEGLRAVSVARDEALTQAMDQTGIEPERVVQEWVATRDSRTRDTHASMGGQQRRRGEPFESPSGATLRYPGDPSAPPSETINCFTGDTPVLAKGIKKVYRRWYEGDLIEIRTRDGNFFSVTPNHPILTSGGWVPAGELKEGCDVISGAFRDGGNARAVDIKDVPARIEDVFSALNKSGDFVRHHGSGVDFHGDGVNANVDIVCAAGLLRSGVDTSSGEHLDKLNLSGSDPVAIRKPFFKSSALFKLILGSFGAANRVMRGGNLCGSLRLRHARPLDCLGLREGSKLSAPVHENVSNGAASDTIFLGQGIFGSAPVVERNALFFVDFGARGGGSIALSGSEANLFKGAPNRGGISAESAGDFVNLEAVAMKADKVVSVSERKAATHVYNLETEEGFYIAHNVIAHNCRCTVKNKILPPS